MINYEMSRVKGEGRERGGKRKGREEKGEGRREVIVYYWNALVFLYMVCGRLYQALLSEA
jgi:hypothetical protein